MNQYSTAELISFKKEEGRNKIESVYLTLLLSPNDITAPNK